MADRPLTNPLPADLPEDWTSGQTVAPAGADAGLSTQHGYNYLMEQVNAAQRAVNTINEGFDRISGKRTCRFVVGTSAAGWTQADCDYLCDGTGDQEELLAAVEALQEKGGGELVVLAGRYFLSESVNFRAMAKDVALTGEPGATVLELSGELVFRGGGSPAAVQARGLTFLHSRIVVQRLSAAFENCAFQDCFLSFEDMSERTGPANFAFRNNYVGQSGIQVLGGTEEGALNVLIDGNTVSLGVDATSGMGDSIEILLSSVNEDGSVVISNNVIMGGSAELNRIQIYGAALLQGNYLNGAYITANRNCTVTGNLVVDGSIDVSRPSEGGGAVCGNRVLAGRIRVDGWAMVSGNFVSPKAGGTAISLGRFSNAERAEVSATVAGNHIVGGSVGILLEKPQALAVKEMACALVTGNRIWDCATPILIESNWSGCMVTGNLFPEGSGVVDQGSGNMVRLNSDDPGGGSGGGTAGVASFKGRTGAVLPQSGDYDAAMVGAIPSGAVADIQVLTQAEYDGLSEKDPAALYLIKE